jgi:hypothetical protein
LVDLEIGKAIAEVAPELRADIPHEAHVPASDSTDQFLRIGEPPVGWENLSESDILA